MSAVSAHTRSTTPKIRGANGDILGHPLPRNGDQWCVDTWEMGRESVANLQKPTMKRRVMMAEDCTSVIFCVLEGAVNGTVNFRKEIIQIIKRRFMKDEYFRERRKFIFLVYKICVCVVPALFLRFTNLDLDTTKYEKTKRPMSEVPYTYALK
jgi:hypothetical protein